MRNQADKCRFTLFNELDQRKIHLLLLLVNSEWSLVFGQTCLPREKRNYWWDSCIFNVFAIKQKNVVVRSCSSLLFTILHIRLNLSAYRFSASLEKKVKAVRSVQHPCETEEESEGSTEARLRSEGSRQKC